MNTTINTNLTIEGTSINVDGENLTESKNVVGIYFNASAPVKDSEYETGYIYIDVTLQDEKGNIETKSWRKKAYYDSKKSPIGKTTDELYKDKAVEDYIGKENSAKLELIDKIIAKDNKINKDILKLRSIDSLQDKFNDME